MESENSSPPKQGAAPPTQDVMRCVDESGTEHLVELRPWRPTMTLARIIQEGEHVACVQFQVLAHQTDASDVTTVVASARAFNMTVQVAQPQPDASAAPFSTSSQQRDPVGDIVYRVLKSKLDGTKVQYEPIGVVVKALQMEVRGSTGASRGVQSVVHIRLLLPVVLASQDSSEHIPKILKASGGVTFETEWCVPVESKCRWNAPSMICVLDEDAGTLASATLGMVLRATDAHRDMIGVTVAHLMPSKTVPSDPVYRPLTLLEAHGNATPGDTVLVPVAVVFAINRSIDSLALTMLTPRLMPVLTRADGTVQPFHSKRD